MSTALLPPGNLSSGTWTWSDPFFGFRFGLINHTWVDLVRYNAVPFQSKKPLGIIKRIGFVMSSFENYREISRLAYPSGLSRLQSDRLQWSSLIITGFNAVSFICDLYNLDLPQTKGTVEKIYVIIFKATPYLAIITNLALMALQFYSNQIGAVVGLATTFVFIPLFRSLRQPFFGWASICVSMFLNGFSFYYGHTVSRIYLIARIALLQKPVQNYLLGFF